MGDSSFGWLSTAYNEIPLLQFSPQCYLSQGNQTGVQKGILRWDALLRLQRFQQRSLEAWVRLYARLTQEADRRIIVQQEKGV